MTYADRTSRFLGCALAALVLVACDGGTNDVPDTGTSRVDSGGGIDSGPAEERDAGTPEDAGAGVDSGPEDAGAMTTGDAGMVTGDAGMMTADAGPCGSHPRFAPVCALFLMRCAGCHTGGAAMGGLAMGNNAVSMHAALVGPDRRIAGACRGPNELVTPGNPAQSFLYLKVTGMQGPGCGAAMPLGTSGLPRDGAELVRTWIAEGAGGP
jgi:hypothetical protein